MAGSHTVAIRMGWEMAISPKIPMMTSPTMPILLSLKSAQLRAKLRRNRRHLIRHIGTWV